jgi:hypothetical protein
MLGKEKLYGYRPKFRYETVIGLAGGIATETLFLSQHMNDKTETPSQIVNQAGEILGSIGLGAVITTTVVGGARLAIARHRALAQDIDGSGSNKNDGEQGDQSLNAHEGFSPMG